MRVVLLGPPGAGKGTHAGVVTETCKIPHISTGDMFRSAIKNGTPVGLEAKSYMDKGELVPDSVVCKMVEERISEADCSNGFLLDGFPRTMAQAKALDAALAAKGQKIDLVINLQCSDEVVLGRLTTRRVCRTCGAIYNVNSKPPKVEGVCDVDGGEVYQRSDDTVETITNRLSVYKAQTAELIDYYRGNGVLKDVKADVDKNETAEAIRSLL
ncbi:adenylate kinase [bacterium]|nr:adenylate kinase [bacterium]MBR5946954.1 adenylate kinase [bacterium]MBR6462329.1 adenylate kinase [bacterium]